MSYDMIATGDRWWSQASQAVKDDYGQECFYIKFKQKSKDNRNKTVWNNIGIKWMSLFSFPVLISVIVCLI